MTLPAPSSRPRLARTDGFHQQYLRKNPNGYCGTGVSCPVGVAAGE